MLLYDREDADRISGCSRSTRSYRVRELIRKCLSIGIIVILHREQERLTRPSDVAYSVPVAANELFSYVTESLWPRFRRDTFARHSDAEHRGHSLASATES